ncbi:hypothetical protein WJX81_005675 [Elliptochloris bilobata]|uniref:DNA2/NAM7 helicase helicase domain-containing protein n=1 Tax=Elliptochloris bilobata TaxID=381761 RepID=A0AAW1QLY3_9CHLO
MSHPARPSCQAKGAERAAGARTRSKLSSRKSVLLELQRLAGAGPRAAIAAPPKPFLEALEDLAQASGKDAAAGAAAAPRGRGRGARRGVQHERLAAHRSAFEAALVAELKVEWAACEERMREWPRARLQAAGLALFDLRAEPSGALFRDAIMRFCGAERSAPLPQHALGPGDIVLVSRGQPDESAVEGVVMEAARSWLRVALPEALAGNLRGPGFRLDLFANTTAHERCVAALADFSRPPGADAPATIALRRALAGADSPDTLQTLAALPPEWARGAAGRERRAEARLRLRAPSAGLNPSQVTAVEAALGRTLTLWQGPPGTGKTATLVALLGAAAAGAIGRGGQVN